MEKSKKVIENISWLYELSLAIGTSLNIEENCRSFLMTLVDKMDAAAASVWLRDDIYEEEDFSSYLLAYTYPTEKREPESAIPEEEWHEELMEKTKILPSPDYWMKDEDEETLDEDLCVVFNLKDNGFLRIYFPKETALPDLNSRLGALKGIMNKFSLSMEGCIAHSKALHETKKRQKIQKKLIQSNDKYESVVRSITEGLVITDLNGYVTFVNDSMCTLCGYSKEEIIETQGYKVMIPKDYWLEYNQKLEERKIGQSDNYEFPIRHKNGTIRWVSVSATPYLDSDGMVIGSLALIVDVTEIKTAQQEILDDKKRLQLILDTSLDAIITIDENSQVTGWNQSAELIMGYTEEEALGQELHELIIPDRMVDKHLAGMKHYKETGIGAVLNQRIELMAVRKSGEEFPVELSIAPIKIQNQYFFSAFLRDITQRKENEDALIRAKQSAEKARNVERQFLAHMSHEIRTPMNAVIGMTYLMRQSSLSKEQSEYVEALKFSADSLMAIISDILDLSKIEAGEIELESRPFSLHYLLESLQKTYQFKVQEKNVSVEINIDDRIKNQIIGDETRVGQILGNLLSNASKFTSNGYIGVNAVLMNFKDGKHWIRFQVYDTGIGISKENIDAIFDSFKQATINTHREFGGTGLGLSIVKQLVELQGGNIRAESALNKGTMFEVILPFLDSGLSIHKDNQSTTQKHQTLDRLKKIDVLIAEDNPINQKLIGSILKQWDVNFDLTQDGVEALEFSIKKKYDLIFMDINMPKMDGYEAVLAIKTDPLNPNKETPIITLTAAALYEERKRMFEAGVSDFITKPFSPQLLQQTIINCLDDATNIDRPTLIPSTVISKLYDLSYLEKFSQGNADFITEMIQLFLDQNPEGIKDLEIAIHEKNWSKAKDVTHQMKSTFGTLGMFQQQQIAKEIEAIVTTEERSVEHIFSLVEQLKEGCEVIYPLLKEELTQ